ncbi:MAG: glycerophosphodiester phosphodiesterase [Candidatus Poseidoniia archaeon]|nr:glycerophosphodiester phosphodiesterase [Candidatus Poseidoniia archaeon]
METKIISHRGRTSRKSADNTLASVNDAIELKVEMVEVDIRQTKDSQIVCFHDPDIQGELIRDLDYSEIIEKDSQIPTLEQVLWSAKGKIGIEIELKEPGYELEVVSIARDYFNYDKFVLKSFHPQVVERVKEIDQKIFAGLLVGSAFSLEQLFFTLKEAFTCTNFKQTNADFISPYYKIFEAGWFSRFTRNNVPIQVWTVNDVESIRTLINQQVHSIITDIPEVAIGIRESLSNESE